jgi:enoyl-CoA hydratase/carnithine racemase
MSMDDDVIVRREGRGLISVLTMEYRPYNLLGPTLIGAIAAEVTAGQEAGSRAIILRSGLRHFSAGADVALFGSRIEQGGRSQAAISGVDFLKLLELLPIPIVASVHGVCLGGGFELALACDYIVAASSLEVALGLHPLLGGIQRQVQRAGNARQGDLDARAALRRRDIGEVGTHQPGSHGRRAGGCDLYNRRRTGARADGRACGDKAPRAHRRQ